MQEALKMPDSSRMQNSLEMPPGALRMQDIPETADAPDTVESHETEGSFDASRSRGMTDALEPTESLEATAPRETAEETETSEPLQMEMEDLQDTPRSPEVSTSPTLSETLKMPLLGIVAVMSFVAAGWNYSSLEDTRAQLSAMSQAKVSVERALADAQGKLSAAEKAVANVKAALTTSPATPAAAPSVKKSEAAPEPAKAKP